MFGIQTRFPLLTIFFAAAALGQELGLNAIDDQTFLIQLDRSAKIVDRRTWKSLTAMDADHTAVNQTKALIMSCVRQPDSKTRLSMHRFQNGQLKLEAQSDLDGVVTQILPANFEQSSFCVTLTHGINRGDKKWSEVFFVRIGEQNPSNNQPHSLFFDPIPSLSGFGGVIVDGLFAEDQEGWFAGIVSVSETALDSFPELRQPTPALAREFRTAFVLTDAKSLRYGWPSTPAFARAQSLNNTKVFWQVVAFRESKVLIRAALDGADQDAYWIVDAQSGKITPCAFLAGISGEVRAVNKNWDAAIIWDNTRAANGEVGWGLRLVNSEPQNILIDQLSTPDTPVAFFSGGNALISYGSRFWEVTDKGSITRKQIAP